MKKITKALALSLIGLMLLGNSDFALSGYASRNHYKQDFLFLLEEAYTQEKNEIQLAVMTSYFNNKVDIELEVSDEEIERKKEITNQWQTIYEIEYGITDRWQIEVQIPYLSVQNSVNNHRQTTDGLGNTELGMSYAVIKEHDIWPELTTGIELTAPTGGKKKKLNGSTTWGYGLFVSASKVIINDFFIHTRGSYGIQNNVKENDETVDEHEFELGMAFVYMYNPSFEFFLETQMEYGIEKNNINNKITYYSNLFIAPAIKYTFENELQVGLSVAKNIIADGFSWGVLARIQYEFNWVD